MQQVLALRRQTLRQHLRSDPAQRRGPQWNERRAPTGGSRKSGAVGRGRIGGKAQRREELCSRADAPKRCTTGSI